MWCGVRLVAGAAASLFVAGCVIIPIPEHRLADSRDIIKPEQIEFLRVGVTRKDEVLLRLGEPDATRDKGATFLYRWMRRGLEVFVVGLYPPGGARGGGDVITYVLRVEFDDWDVLRDYGTSQSVRKTKKGPW